MTKYNVETYYIRIPQKGIERHHLMKIREFLDLEELIMLNKYIGKRKAQFAYSRYLAKYQLSKLMNIPLSNVKFIKTETGKLFLSPECIGNKKMFQFSISHSGNICVCSISETSEVGVDIENIVKYSRLEIMYKVFNNSEQQQVNNQHNQYEKLREFYRIWTKKEAAFKAINDGISSIYFNDINVPLQLEESYKTDWLFESKVIENNFMISITVKNTGENAIGGIYKLDINQIL
ncbi:4'-phosphopantetheinyl transferase family protein [Oceanobacillus oncorhynchi]|uniref:4'-phosphopantetheinyl transferase family protein n=1 Tax=Oceanobacillus oncorhynchi TaxID=545501 RepID=UPI001868CE6B|nr:4'-phosphopantetheinyl transferase superfamily protein [Oceanobacillus oncorhynchi]